MNVLAIYQKYLIPENLQMHMLRVAACGNLIIDHWTGPALNTNSLLRVLLLHDMGNILKITPDQIKDSKFLAFREECIAKYGHDDHLLTEAICTKEGLTPEEISIMNEKIFMKNDKTLLSDSFMIKIAAYCDQRVAPNGVSSLKERMEEGKLRYQNRPGTSFNNPRTDEMIAASYEIEKQIMQYCTITPEDINDISITPYLETLKQYSI